MIPKEFGSFLRKPKLQKSDLKNDAFLHAQLHPNSTCFQGRSGFDFDIFLLITHSSLFDGNRSSPRCICCCEQQVAYRRRQHLEIFRPCLSAYLPLEWQDRMQHLRQVAPQITASLSPDHKILSASPVQGCELVAFRCFRRVGWPYWWGFPLSLPP